jgi:DNA-binding transcriptional LysR family regulator
MDSKWIEDALVLIEEGTLSAAAARRHITQPAFSRRIRALEDWIGEPLVDRRANRADLTPALLAREDEFRALLDKLHGLQGPGRAHGHPLVIATQHSLATSVFPEIYRKLRDLDWIGQVRLRTRNQDEIIPQFIRHEVDLVLSYQASFSAGVPFDDTVLQRVWRRDSMVPVVGGALRFELSTDKVPKPNTPILGYPDDSEFGRIVNSRPEARLLEGAKVPVLQTAFAATIVTLVRQGMGIGWVPQSLIRDDLQKGDVIALNTRFGRIPIDVVLSAHQGENRGRKVLSALVPDADG